MVHERVLVFSKERPTVEQIEKLFTLCFTDKETGYCTVDGYSGIREFPYVPDNIKDKYFIQLSDLWSLNEWDIGDNLNYILQYITIDKELKYEIGEKLLAYTHTLPDTTWIALMWIAP